jgi:hypothetical protein
MLNAWESSGIVDALEHLLETFFSNLTFQAKLKGEGFVWFLKGVVALVLL